MCRGGGKSCLQKLPITPLWENRQILPDLLTNEMAYHTWKFLDLTPWAPATVMGGYLLLPGFLSLIN